MRETVRPQKKKKREKKFRVGGGGGKTVEITSEGGKNKKISEDRG